MMIGVRDVRSRYRLKAANLGALAGAVLAVGLVNADPALGESPTAGTYETGRQARDAFRARDYATAAPLYEAVCRANPHRAAYWEALGHCYLRTEQYDRADSAFSHCLLLSYRIPETLYNRACAFALAGRAGQALDALAEAYAHGFINDHLVRQDSDLDPIRPRPRFGEITGRPDPALRDRETRWQADLTYFDRRMRELHVDLFHQLAEEAYEAELHRIRASVPARDDTELKYALQALLARIGDGHTAVVSDRFRVRHGFGGHGGEPAQLFPFEPWLFADGVRIRRIDSAHQELRGAKISRIGDTPMEDALRLIESLVSRDNEWNVRWISMEVLATPGALRSLGLIPDGTRLELVVQPVGEDEGRTVQLHAIDATEVEHRLQTPSGSDVLAASEVVRYLRHSDQPFWLERVAEHGILWWQFNRVSDAPHETLAQLAERLGEELSDPGTRALVIDLRRNHGGQGHLVQPLLHTLIRWHGQHPEAGLFALIGRETFSAAMAFATQLETHLPVIFVGEPTGSRPNFIGESSIFVLPYSGIAISCSTRFHQNGSPIDTRTAIGPHIFAPITFEEEAAGRDPAYEAVVEALRSSDERAQRP